MSDEVPISKGRLASENDKRWLTLFNKIEENQLDLLDQSGKRIVELTGVLLGVLLGAVSFGDKFPPDYLRDDRLVKGMVILVLVFYLAAMFMGMWTTYPRHYKRYPNNLTLMESEFSKMVVNKIRALRVAGVCFLLGSLALAGVLVLIVFQA